MFLKLLLITCFSLITNNIYASHHSIGHFPINHIIAYNMLKSKNNTNEMHCTQPRIYTKGEVKWLLIALVAIVTTFTLILYFCLKTPPMFTKSAHSPILRYKTEYNKRFDNKT